MKLDNVKMFARMSDVTPATDHYHLLIKHLHTAPGLPDRMARHHNLQPQVILIIECDRHAIRPHQCRGTPGVRETGTHQPALSQCRKFLAPLPARQASRRGYCHWMGCHTTIPMAGGSRRRARSGMHQCRG